MSNNRGPEGPVRVESWSEKPEEPLSGPRARPRRDRTLSADEMIDLLLRWAAGRPDPSP